MICRSSSEGPHANIPTNVKEVGIVITQKCLRHALDVVAFPTSWVVDFSGHSIFGRVVYVHKKGGICETYFFEQSLFGFFYKICCSLFAINEQMGWCPCLDWFLGCCQWGCRKIWRHQSLLEVGALWQVGQQTLLERWCSFLIYTGEQSWLRSSPLVPCSHDSRPLLLGFPQDQWRHYVLQSSSSRNRVQRK